MRSGLYLLLALALMSSPLQVAGSGSHSTCEQCRAAKLSAMRLTKRGILPPTGNQLPTERNPLRICPSPCTLRALCPTSGRPLEFPPPACVRNRA